MFGSRQRPFPTPNVGKLQCLKCQALFWNAWYLFLIFVEISLLKW